MNSYEIQDGIRRMVDETPPGGGDDYQMRRHARMGEEAMTRQQQRNALVDARDAWETAVVKHEALRKTQRDLSDALIKANEAVMQLEDEIPELHGAYLRLLLEVHGAIA